VLCVVYMCCVMCCVLCVVCCVVVGSKRLKEHGVLELLSSVIDGQEVIYMQIGKYRVALVSTTTHTCTHVRGGYH
jgi:hypothetical protein